MRSPILDYLDEIIEKTAEVTGGAPADYIPELAAADPDRVAIAMCTVSGTVYAVGDAEDLFTIQSMSKPFAYGLAIEQRGLDEVLEHVGVEPSGDAFNELSLDPENGRPLNPMINAGAITTHSLMCTTDPVDRLLTLIGAMVERPVEVDEKVAASEQSEASRNLGLAYLLDAQGVLASPPQEAVSGYIRQCSASVTVRDLALMAATLANGGVQPNTGERVLGRRTTRQVLSVMASCGMYDAAGDWFTAVGIPAKSGVAGGIMGVLPGQVGLAVFSPRLDAHGNSARGVKMMELLSEDMDLHLMDPGRPARTAVRARHTRRIGEEDATVLVLEGDLELSTIEMIVDGLVSDPPSTRQVVFDLSRVDEVRDVARRTSSNMTTKLLDEGYEVVVVDPDEVLSGFKDSRGREVTWWTPEQLADASS